MIDIEALNKKMNEIESMDQDKGHRLADQMFHEIILELAPPELRDDLKALIERFNEMPKWYS